MKISYVIIVLNGMPFIEFSLKAIYKSAYEIIIVEGAVKTCMFAAKPNGSPVDGTSEFLNSFPDPNNKIKIIRGKWSDKCAMQNKALECISGDYVWLIDADEVYSKAEIQKVILLLERYPQITLMNFFPYHFWKGFDYIISTPVFTKEAYSSKRVFKFVPGARFNTHRPPTMVYPPGKIRKQCVLTAKTMMDKGVRSFHYSYVLDSQVLEKIEWRCRRCSVQVRGVDRMEWYTEGFLKWTPENRLEIEKKYPTHTSDPKASTELYTGPHPKVIQGYVERFRKESSYRAFLDLKTKERLAAGGAVKSLIFKCDYHKGDCHHSRMFLKNIVKSNPGWKFYRRHEMERTLHDVPMEYIIENIPGIPVVDFWVGAKKQKFLNLQGPKRLYLGIWPGALKALWNDICTEHHLVCDTSDYIAEIDYSMFETEKIDAFFSTIKKPCVIVSNGIVRSGQAHNFSMDPIIDKLKPFFTIVTTKDRNKLGEYFIGDIVKRPDEDLSELSYLSTKAYAFIGRSSGPYVFSLVKENYNSLLKMICIAKDPEAVYWDAHNSYWISSALDIKVLVAKISKILGVE